MLDALRDTHPELHGKLDAMLQYWIMPQDARNSGAKSLQWVCERFGVSSNSLPPLSVLNDYHDEKLLEVHAVREMVEDCKLQDDLQMIAVAQACSAIHQSIHYTWMTVTSMAKLRELD